MWPLIISFLISFSLGPLVINFYQKHHWVDDPKKNHHVKVTHTKPVPRGGGILIFIAVFLSSIIFLHFDKYLIAIFLGAFILTIVGIIDDIFNISPYWRLLTGLLATLIVVGSGIGIAYVSNPFGPGVIHLDQPQLHFVLFGEERNIWLLSSAFAILFIMWNMNIINWSKGVDGQLPGFVMVACLLLQF